jgi:hypothetical protein
MENTQTAVVAQPELTSELLVKLTADKKAAWKNLQKFDDPDSKEFKDANLAFYKIQSDIKSEQANLQKLENDRKIAEQRSILVANVTNYKNAVLANTGKGANDETKNAENTLYEVLVNLLIPKTGHRAAATKSDGEPKTGTKKQHYNEICWPLFESGIKQADVIKQTGFNHSAVFFSYKEWSATKTVTS